MRGLLILPALLLLAACADSPTGPAVDGADPAARVVASAPIASTCETPHCRPGFRTAEPTTELPEAASVLDFESLELMADGRLDGEHTAPALTLGEATFVTTWNAEFSIAGGLTVSNNNDTTTPGFMNGYSAFPGSGAGGSSQFAVWNPPFGSDEPMVTFSTPVAVQSVRVTNNTYAALSMTTGDQFAKAFTEADEDFLMVTIGGVAADGSSTGSVDVYLADFRPGSVTGVLDTWAFVDLSPLGQVTGLTVEFASSDVGSFGINTPLYVALDDLIYTP